MAQVITEEGAHGRSYVRRAMEEPAELGLAETNGKVGRHPIWNLTPAGQKALAERAELRGDRRRTGDTGGLTQQTSTC